MRMKVATFAVLVLVLATSVTLVVYLTKKRSGEPTTPAPPPPLPEDNSDDLPQCEIKLGTCESANFMRRAEYTTNPETGEPHIPGVTCDPSGMVVIADDTCDLIDIIPEIEQEWWYGGHHKAANGSEVGILLHIVPYGREATMTFFKYDTPKEIKDLSQNPKYLNGAENAQPWDVYTDHDAKTILGTVKFNVSVAIDLLDEQSSPQMHLTFFDNPLVAPQIPNFGFLFDNGDESSGKKTISIYTNYIDKPNPEDPLNVLLLRFGKHQFPLTAGQMADFKDGNQMVDGKFVEDTIRFHPIDLDTKDSMMSKSCPFGLAFNSYGESGNFRRGEKLPTGNCANHPCAGVPKWAGPAGEFAQLYENGAWKCTERDAGVDPNPCTVANVGCWFKSGDFKPCMQLGLQKCSTQDGEYGFSEMDCQNSGNANICKLYKDEAENKEQWCRRPGLTQGQIDGGMQACCESKYGPGENCN